MKNEAGHVLKKFVYKANECTDVNDVENAIKELKTFAYRLNNYTPAMRRRLASLEKRKKQLSK